MTISFPSAGSGFSSSLFRKKSALQLTISVDSQHLLSFLKELLLLNLLCPRKWPERTQISFSQEHDYSGFKTVPLTHVECRISKEVSSWKDFTRSRTLLELGANTSFVMGEIKFCCCEMCFTSPTPTSFKVLANFYRQIIFYCNWVIFLWSSSVAQ